MESVATGPGPYGPNIVAGRGCRLVRSPTRPSRLLGRLIVVAAAAAAGFLSLSGAPPPPTASISAPRPAAPNGIDTIEHVIIVVQENRSFDHYFGTYPGADGFPGRSLRRSERAPTRGHPGRPGLGDSGR
jgi:phospholipase C